MSYEVPKNTPLPRRWPHWYALLSLAFHSWIIWRGIALNKVRARSGHSYSDWFADQKLLFGLSIVLVVLCIISLILRNHGAWLVAANAVYSLIIATSVFKGTFSQLSLAYLIEGYVTPVGWLILANFVYAAYRIFAWLKEPA